VQPIVTLSVFILQERAGGRSERDVEEPLRRWFRVALAAHALGLTAVAIALWPVRADGFWPWPLPDLGAAAIAVWLVTFAVSAAWCLYERDWRRARIVFPSYLTFLVLLLLAAARFSDAFDGGAWPTWTWLATIVLSLGVLGGGAIEQELVSRRRERRAASLAATQQPA